MIRMMLCYSRSGGTLLNKCLGSLSNVVMLSEVSPYGGGWGKEGKDSKTTIYEQALHWYGIKLSNNGYYKDILELEEICENQGKKLIVRDWSYIYFSPHRCNDFSPPNEFINLEGLNKFSKLRIFGFVRDSIDVWISRGKPDLDEFYFQYNNYTNSIQDLGVSVFKYENFTKEPSKELRKICNYLDIPYDEDVLSTYNEYNFANGDTQKINGSRGARKSTISILPRKKISWGEVQKLNNHSGMKKANNTLGYTENYYSNDFLYLFEYRKYIFTNFITNTFLGKNNINRIAYIVIKIGQKIIEVGNKLKVSHTLNSAHQKKRKALELWRADRGDNILRITYPLNEDSIVFDLGGYQGDWASKIFCKYACNIFIFEINRFFYDDICFRFSDNSKLKVFPYGLGKKNESVTLSLNGTGTSIFHVGGPSQIGKIVQFSQFVSENDIQKIDLMKINIEGGEYELLEHILDTKLIEKIINIQVQFHNFVPNAEKRMINIRKLLSETHYLTYQYSPWIWENWEIKFISDHSTPTVRITKQEQG